MKIICGVDVSKAHLDAHLAPGGAYARFANDAEGIAALTAFCRTGGVELVAMEATGGYERMAFLLLGQSAVACAVVNARQVRDYARSMGFLEKTDRIDAAMIAGYAAARSLSAGEPANLAGQRLKALVTRLGQVTGDLTVQKQRLSMTADIEARASLGDLIAFLKRQSRTLEGEIASMIDDDPLWARLDQAFRSVKGVAGRTVAHLMAELPEIGTLSNKAASKLVGLAPLCDDSGGRTGKRHIRGGRAGLRSILFLVAGVAAKYDQSLAAFHQRLLAAGKPKMVARIALAHKLLVRLNAKARDARTEMANAT